jgi:hypothetical protein
MEKTELLFFVMAMDDHWAIRSEEQRYGPFTSYWDAYRRAVDEAQAAGSLGFASAVLVRATRSGAFRLRWTYGRNGPAAPAISRPARLRGPHDGAVDGPAVEFRPRPPRRSPALASDVDASPRTIAGTRP